MRFEIELPYRPPLDWDALLEFLALRAIPGVERVEGGRYERTIALGAAAGTLRAGACADRPALALAVELRGGRVARRHVEQRARRIFDLDADPGPIAARFGRDRLLAPIVDAHPGLRVPGCWDGFELAARAVLGQQVTVRGAATLAGRLVAAHGSPCSDSGAGGLTHLFPAATALEQADLSGIGLPARRAQTLRQLAREVAAGRLSLEPEGDLAGAVAAIKKIPGVGDWTAEYVAMRALRDADAFPSSDLVLRRAAADGGAMLSSRELSRRAEAWRPWRAYAAIHLWRRG